MSYFFNCFNIYSPQIYDLWLKSVQKCRLYPIDYKEFKYYDIIVNQKCLMQESENKISSEVFYELL